MQYLYTSFLTVISWLLPLLALINAKTKLWYHGRKNQTYPVLHQSPVWIHCASLGEFEQGRPLIEAIKREWPTLPVVLTFFSSSGYEIRKNYQGVDWVGYMPLDLPKYADEFIAAIHPKLTIFVKYEYWFNHLLALHRSKIPFIFISNVWRPHYFPLKWWAGWYLNTIKKGTAFFVQDQVSFEILKKNNFPSFYLAGDTRIDRVKELIKWPKKLDHLDAWSKDKSVLIGGSTWPDDEKLLYRFYLQSKDIRIILVPHDPSPGRLEEIKKQFKALKPCLYSQWRGEDEVNILIVDSIGLLNRLYGYAQAAYIGGGFDKGIHNTLEAAVYGIPVFFGPRHENFKEALDMIDLKVAYAVKDANDLQDKYRQLIPSELLRIKGQLSQYFNQNQGATAKIIDYLRAFIQS